MINDKKDFIQTNVHYLRLKKEKPPSSMPSKGGSLGILMNNRKLNCEL